MIPAKSSLLWLSCKACRKERIGKARPRDWYRSDCPIRCASFCHRERLRKADVQHAFELEVGCIHPRPILSLSFGVGLEDTEKLSHSAFSSSASAAARHAPQTP